MEQTYIPRDILHIILEYDGRIKYKKGVYTNIISKNDIRYSCMDVFIRRKIKIFQRIEYNVIKNRFFFTIEFFTFFFYLTLSLYFLANKL